VEAPRDAVVTQVGVADTNLKAGYTGTLGGAKTTKPSRAGSVLEGRQQAHLFTKLVCGYSCYPIFWRATRIAVSTCGSQSDTRLLLLRMREKDLSA